MEPTAKTKERRTEATQPQYDDFARYLDIFNGDVSLAFHWYNEQCLQRGSTLITRALADDYLARWRGF